MKCEIIRDLLPSYIDELTSEESNKEIDNHLNTCEACTECYKDMTEDLTDVLPKAGVDDTTLFKKVKKNLFFQRLCLLLLPFVVGAAGIYIFSFIEFPVNLDNNAVEIYELKNGDLYVELILPAKCNRLRFYDATEESNYQLTKRQENLFEANIYCFYTLWDRIENSTPPPVPAEPFTAIVKRSNLLADKESMDTFKGITYGREGKDEYKILWEEGDPLKKAPEHIENAASAYLEK